MLVDAPDSSSMPPRRRKVLILGSTGSIGASAMKVSNLAGG